MFQIISLKIQLCSGEFKMGQNCSQVGRGKITRGKNNHVYSISTILKCCFFNGYCSCNLFIFYFAVDDTSH